MGALLGSRIAKKYRGGLGRVVQAEARELVGGVGGGGGGGVVVIVVAVVVFLRLFGLSFFLMLVELQFEIVFFDFDGEDLGSNRRGVRRVWPVVV